MTVKNFNEDDITKLIINPFYAINIAEGLFGDHPPIVTEEQWVKCNTVAIEKLGAEAWLTQLLEVLKGGYVTGEATER